MLYIICRFIIQTYFITFLTHSEGLHVISLHNLDVFTLSVATRRERWTYPLTFLTIIALLQGIYCYNIRCCWTVIINNTITSKCVKSPPQWVRNGLKWTKMVHGLVWCCYNIHGFITLRVLTDIYRHFLNLLHYVVAIALPAATKTWWKRAAWWEINQKVSLTQLDLPCSHSVFKPLSISPPSLPLWVCLVISWYFLGSAY